MLKSTVIGSLLFYTSNSMQIGISYYISLFEQACAADQPELQQQIPILCTKKSL